MLANLCQSRVLLDDLRLQFTSGMAHFYKYDNVESLIYRCMKDHNQHLKKKSTE